ncbi:histone-lysine N-methyltransferase SMYD1a [Engraulis encrasicolus]|uniref:histone-lysine N-methyltransferase SMYD1a n=1 Tax=Engraulis encrasicolus TaxID=184585 RepID=UPI002FD59A7A
MTLQKKDPVEVFDAGAKGRGLRTTKALVAGDVVFTEGAYAAVVFDSMALDVCHNCFRRQANPHRCAQCKFAHYCDRTCQRAAWDEHKKECSAIRNIGMPPKESVRLVARTMWRMQKHGPRVTDSQLSSLDWLQDHLSDMTEEEKKILEADVQKFMDYWPKSRRTLSRDYIAHLFGVLKVNGFSLSDQRGLAAVGVGIFPNLCLVNHDCWPNCTVILNHGNQSALDSALHSQRRIELRAMGPIAEGEELTVSYVDFLNLAKDRQKALKKQYYFECSCEHCTKGIKDDLMMATKETADKKAAAEQAKEVTELSVKTFEKVEEARLTGDFETVVKLCRECLQKQEALLADTHLHQLRILCTASEVLSYRRNFKEAAECANRMVAGYSKLYPANNAQMGMAIMRAGVTNWHAGNIEQGHNLICQAFGILMVTHGPHHPITMDLEMMRTQTEMELKLYKQNAAVYESVREAALKGTPLPEKIKEQVKELTKEKEAAKEPAKKETPPPPPEPIKEVAKETPPTPEPVKEEVKALSPEPAKALSPEPVKALSPEPVKALSPEPAKALSPEPAKALSPEPAKALSPEPAKALSPKPEKALSPEPAKALSPEPAKALSPKPEKALSPEPAKALSPKPEKALSPEPAKALSPKPEKALSPEPEKALSPPPAKALSPPPAKALSPQPGKALSPQPGKALSPQPGKALSPQPGKALSPKPLRAFSPKPAK